MSRTIITLFFILAISTAGVLSHEIVCPCGKNEMWSACNGHCQQTCVDPIPPCTRICVSGCICKPGYLQNKNGTCVRKGCCNWDNWDDDSSE